MIVKHFEMGQRTSTGLITLVAEELDITMDQVDVEFAPSDPQVYDDLLFGPFQDASGSTAIANSSEQYRKAGAAAREMLIAVAAEEWSADEGALDIVDGHIAGAGNSAPIGDFVAASETKEAPAEPRLRRRRRPIMSKKSPATMSDLRQSRWP